MNKNDFNKSLDKIEPTEIQEDRMLDKILNEQKKSGRTSRKIAFSAVAVVLCFIFGFIMFSDTIGTYLFERQLKKQGSVMLEIPQMVENYDELYSLINASIEEDRKTAARYTTEVESSAKSFDDVVSPAISNSVNLAESTSGDSSDYSDTNLQVAGVQEADIVKTDGKYIYAMSEKYLYIVSAENGELKIVSKISRNVDSNNYDSGIYEMYIAGDYLIALRNAYSKVKYSNSGTARTYEEPINDIAGTEFDNSYYYVQTGVSIEIYDISDKANPKLINTIGQSGYYVSSRMINNNLYLVSNYFAFGEIDKNKPETFVPQLHNGDESSLILTRDIMINTKKVSSQYLVITGIDISNGGNIVSSKALLGYGTSVYANRENMYVTAYEDVVEGNKHISATKIFRFSLNGGKVDIEAEATIPGNIHNQFSLDEYDGNLRIVTTVNSYIYSQDKSLFSKIMPEFSGGSTSNYEEYNCLYVLNLNLEIVGKIEHLAPDERIYSARFDGDIGYFVTFRQVDPLFAVDLSTPDKLEILSELKIPGFSDYLHPYGDGLLFGLGRNADESGRVDFLKLSMFDTSDLYNVNEKHKLTIQGKYYSEATYNHKAILINHEKNIIAFLCDNEYCVYSYSKETGFKKEAFIKLINEYDYQTRGLYIGDFLYVVSQKGIVSYDMNSYELCNKITLK